MNTYLSLKTISSKLTFTRYAVYINVEGFTFCLYSGCDRMHNPFLKAPTTLKRGHRPVLQIQNGVVLRSLYGHING